METVCAKSSFHVAEDNVCAGSDNSKGTRIKKGSSKQPSKRCSLITFHYISEAIIWDIFHLILTFQDAF